MGMNNYFPIRKLAVQSLAAGVKTGYDLFADNDPQLAHNRFIAIFSFRLKRTSDLCDERWGPCRSSEKPKSCFSISFIFKILQTTAVI